MFFFSMLTFDPSGAGAELKPEPLKTQTIRVFRLEWCWGWSQSLLLWVSGAIARPTWKCVWWGLHNTGVCCILNTSLHEISPIFTSPWATLKLWREAPKPKLSLMSSRSSEMEIRNQFLWLQRKRTNVATKTVKIISKEDPIYFYQSQWYWRRGLAMKTMLLQGWADLGQRNLCSIEIC